MGAYAEPDGEVIAESVRPDELESTTKREYADRDRLDSSTIDKVTSLPVGHWHLGQQSGQESDKADPGDGATRLKPWQGQSLKFFNCGVGQCRH
jgi:hypothetical protein